MSDRDYYEILGVTPGVDGTMVDQAYWHLARKYQTLAATNEHAGYMLDELNEAYGVIGNPRLREQYDAFRDDVLIRKGILKPVASKQPKQKRRRKKKEAPTARPAVARAPSLSISLPAAVRWYALAGALVLVGVGGAYVGLGASIVVLALAGGLGVALLQTAKTRLTNVSLSMPEVNLPDVTLPEVRRPRVELPDLRLPQAAALDRQLEELPGPDELRTSTAAMIARWRKSIGLLGDEASRGPEQAPSLLLREIVAAERAGEDESEPLAAALNVLSGNRRRQAPRN